MKLGSKNTLMVHFLKLMLSDKEDKYYLVKPEWAGNIRLDSGSKAKKYQYIKGDLAIPHSVLTDEIKNDARLLHEVSFVHFAYIPKKYINEKTRKDISETEEDIQMYFSKNPKVKEAYDNLLAALKEVN